LSALVAVGTGCSAGGAAGDAVDVLAQVGTERFDCWMSGAVANVRSGRNWLRARCVGPTFQRCLP
jgi:hypothetical protein